MPSLPNAARRTVSHTLVALAIAASWPVLAAAAPSTHPATLPDTLEQRLQACIVCHAAKERSDVFFPRISGKPAGYLYNQLVNFRDGRRQYPVMTYMVGQLPDAYLREIAQYFSEQHPVPPPAQSSTASAATLERGRALTMFGDPAKKVPACIACHGQQLTGVAPAIPGLLGLPRDYINAQFGAWKNKTRHAIAPDCMAEIASRLPVSDIAAVSAWLGTQVAAPDARPATTIALPLPLHCGSVEGAQP